MTNNPFLLTKHDQETARAQPILARILTDEEVNNVSGGFPTIRYTSEPTPGNPGNMVEDGTMDDTNDTYGGGN